jgi:hypothetical protein
MAMEKQRGIAMMSSLFPLVGSEVHAQWLCHADAR